MSDLTNIEKRNFEKLFAMSSGYVLDFSNRTLDELVIDSTGLSILEEKYNENSGSKANRLRKFWSIESNQIVVKLLTSLMQGMSIDSANLETKNTYEECRKIVERLSKIAGMPEVLALTPNSPDREFAVLAREVRESIERNEPEVGLDRLHTYTVKYLRILCEKYGITTEKDKPLHSLIGEYIKAIRALGHLESEMTERILKSSISTLESFNSVRNNHSLAHDNKLINYEESVIIYTHVASSIRFLEALEKKIS